MKERLVDLWETLCLYLGNVVSFGKDCRYFVKNCWRFRKVLWNFRPWDWSYNYGMFNTSLRMTRDFLRSGNTVTADAAERADEIDFYLREFAMSLDASREAGIQTGWDELSSRYNDYSLCASMNREEHARYVERVHQLEYQHWQTAMVTLREKSQRWWD